MFSIIKRGYFKFIPRDPKEYNRQQKLLKAASFMMWAGFATTILAALTSAYNTVETVPPGLVYNDDYHNKKSTSGDNKY